MQRIALYRKNHLRVTVAVLGFLLLGLCPVLWAASPSPISIGTNGFQMEKNYGPKIPLNQPLMTVNVPVNISKLPGSWKQSTVLVQVAVFFLDEAGEPVGYGGSSMGNNVPIQNGSYSGTMAFPIKETEGGITANTCVIAIATAKLGEQNMFLGGSTGGTSPNAIACDIPQLQLTPGTIMEPAKRKRLK